MNSKYDWQLIQKDHNDGFTWKQLQFKYGVSSAALSKAKKRGAFASRNKSEALKLVPGKPHSEETKKKLSLIRKKYLLENPDKVPYKLNHYSKRKSFPEIYFENWLLNHKIIFEAQKSVSIYTIDFYINNIALEIDGEQHYVDERIKKSNFYRDEYLNSLGIKTIRVRWSLYQKLSKNEKKKYLDNLLKILTNNFLYINNCWFNKPPIINENYCVDCKIQIYKKSKRCKSCATKINNKKSRKFEISKNDLINLIKQYPMTKVGSILGVSDNAVRKRCRSLGIDYKSLKNI